MTTRVSFGITGLVLALFAVAPPAHAGPASGGPLVLEQPGGRRFAARAWGDEWANGLETAAGYTVLRDRRGRWTYAEPGAAGRLVAGSRVVGIDDPAGLALRLRPQAGAARAATTPGGSPPAAAPPAPGTHRLLVVVVDFTPSISKGVTEAQFQEHFFTGGGTYAPTSFKDYWDTVSNGAITIAPAEETYGTADDGIVFVTLGTANPNCGTVIGDCHRQITANAITAADSVVDFSSFDGDVDGYLNTNELHVYVVVRGNEGSFTGNSCGNSTTWGHRWSLGFGAVAAPVLDGTVVGHYLGAPAPGSVFGGYMQEGEWHQGCPSPSPGHPSTIGGASVHEFGHDMGLPDLYDSQTGVGTSGQGVGEWSVMGTGGWLTTGAYAGMTPSWPDAYSRWWLGFLTPTAISTTTLGVSFPQTETAAGPDRGVHVVPGGAYTHWDSFNCLGGTGEYFLLENRQAVGYDADLPGNGLLIWHIYEDMDVCVPNGDEGTSAPGNPRLVVLEQADGLYGLDCYSGGQCNRGDAGDPWRTGTATAFDATTTPSSRWYSGADSGIAVWNVGASGSTMTADVIIAVCGDGSIDGLEGCDDGGTGAGDGCDAACAVEECWSCVGEPSVCTPVGGPCDDGDACTDGDVCSGGACLPGPPLVCDDATACTTDSCNPSSGCVYSPDDGVCAVCQACVSGSGCVAEPRNDCFAPDLTGYSKLVVKDKTPDTKDIFLWKWLKGAALSPGDFGQPNVGDDQVLCVFDDVSGTPDLVTSLVAPAAGTCAGQPCWKQLATGFKYVDTETTPNGLLKVVMKASVVQKSKIVVKGKGDDLPSFDLPLTLPVTVQLQSGGGACWTTTFGATNLKQNDTAAFNGKDG